MKGTLDEQAKKLLKEDYAHLLTPKKVICIIGFVTIVNILVAVAINLIF